MEAFDEVEKVMEGKHERLMVASLEKFLDRAAEKARRSGPAHRSG